MNILPIQSTHAPGTDERPRWAGVDFTAWTVTLTFEGRTMSVPFFMGPGHKGAPPTTDMVMDALVSDASCLHSAGSDFQMWCWELGFDADEIDEPETVRDNAQTFLQTVKQTDRLAVLLGDDFQRVMDGEATWPGGESA